MQVVGVCFVSEEAFKDRPNLFISFALQIPVESMALLLPLKRWNSMNTDPEMIRAERYAEIGRLIRSSASAVIDEWSRVARRDEDQESARLAHRQELRNHLPLFLEQMGGELASHRSNDEPGPDSSARSHGKQRWDLGWSLDEVIRDYQLLRLVLLEHLDDQLDRKLNLDEIKAVGLLLDDAIQHAVSTYVEYHEQHLAESEERSRGTFENAAIGIGHVDLQGGWLRANSRLCETLGYKLEELLRMTFQRFTNADDYVAIEAAFANLLGGKITSFNDELRIRHRDGHEIWVNATVSLQRVANRDPLYFIVVLEDISKRRQLDSDLETAKRKAEESNRLKSEFVANVSHEIRTPMNAILGMTELALDEDLSPTLRDYLSTTHESAKSLLALVNDLLDFSRMEAGRLELESTPFDLWQTIDETAKTLSIAASEKGLELMTDVDASVPRYAEGDPLRLRQVITNLVSNAIKFTEQGEVVIRVSLQTRSATHSVVRFAVRDTGIGISDEDKERIFAPFTQADASTTRVFGGSGLGLAICTELINQLGGTLDVTSEVGSGSEFFFTAHFQNANPPRELVKRRRDGMGELTGNRVLVVDDNATNRTIIEGILTRFGIQVHSVDCGSSVIGRMRMASSANQPYDIVIVDALMPGLDGFSVVEEINADEELQSTIVLMLSSADRSTFADRSEELNIDGFLDKPVTRRELLEILSFVKFGAKEDADDEASVSVLPRSLRVLVAEDTPANQKVVQAILRKRGHNITLASNGREAIEKLAAAPFDVVLMDIQMPTIDGYQATTAIRQMDEREQANIPIIAMTAHAMKGDADKCMEHGMNDYISKPINSRRLIELVEEWGGNAMEADPAKQTASANLKETTSMNDESDAFAQSTATQDQTKIADFEIAIKRLDGNVQLLRDMISFFREDTPDLMTQLESGIENGDARTVKRAAHSIKGLAANFEAVGVMQLAFSIEEAASKGELDALQPQLEALRLAIADLHRALDHYERDN